MTLLLALGSAVLYLIAYHTYGRYLARRIFKINPDAVTPAHSLRDDRDYLPTRRGILFGHHYTSIAGTGPIVGPAIAIIWGWLPALLWVVLGSIFMGAVHDFGALVISARYQGRSIGDVAGDLIGKRAYIFFVILVFISLWILLAVFVLVIANIFELYPQAVFPVWMQIPIAVGLGWILYRKQVKPLAWTLLAVALMYGTVVAGAYLPFKMPEIAGIPPLLIWMVLLFVYAFIASILPVWTLLQPRDYINGYQLMVAMVLLVVGVIVARPEMAAPAIQVHPAGAPPMLPFLFITVACGAISGFHALVGSGTSSKQLNHESDAQFVGYGSMLLEGFLAILVLIAAGAGIGLHYQFTGANGAIETLTGRAAWMHHYTSWGAAQGLGAKLGAFVHGSSNMLALIGIPFTIALALMGMFVASFAGTSLDTAMRLQRYVVAELATHTGIKPLQNPWGATTFATLTAMALAFLPVKDAATGAWVLGKGGLTLWPLFGASNQLVAALALIVLSVYLLKKRVPVWVSALPMVLMVTVTVWALSLNLTTYLEQGKWHLLLIGFVLLVVELLLVIEGAREVLRMRRKADASIPAEAEAQRR